FSLDGNSVYVLNCGPECGGAKSGMTVLQTGALLIDNIPTTNPLSPTAPSPLANIGVPNPVPIPGGATVALSNGTTLYVAGQSLYSLGAGGVLGSTPRADGLFTGYLSAINLSNTPFRSRSPSPTAPIPSCSSPMTIPFGSARSSAPAECAPRPDRTTTASPWLLWAKARLAPLKSFPTSRPAAPR